MHTHDAVRTLQVYVLQSTTSDAKEANALAELHMALAVAGIQTVLVVPPRREPKKKKSPRDPSSSSAPVTAVLADGQVVGEQKGRVKNVTSSLPVEQLQAGDIIVFPASSPPPPQWMHTARLRQALLVSWLFSWRDLGRDSASSGLDAPPHALWMDWDAGMVAHMMEGDLVKATGSGGAANVWAYRAAASHSVLWSSSTPAGSLLVPPLPAMLHQVEEHSRFGLLVRDPDEHGLSRENHKHDLILCRGVGRKCLSLMHDTIRALPGSGFCPVLLATVRNVQRDSPAHNAGLMTGDLVLAAGLVSGGIRDAQEALQDEVRNAKDQLLRVTVQRPHRAAIMSLDLTPQTWQGDGLLGWTLEFESAVRCPSGDEHLLTGPGSTNLHQRHVTIFYIPEDLEMQHMRSLLIAAKVLVRQSSWGAGGAGDSLGAVELEAALYDVCMLVPSDAAAAVDWPIGSRLVFEPHVHATSLPVLLLQTLLDYDALSPERGVLKEYIKGTFFPLLPRSVPLDLPPLPSEALFCSPSLLPLHIKCALSVSSRVRILRKHKHTGLPAALSSAAHLMVHSAQHLFYTVALDVRDEAAACTFILSARLSHPLATVEVLVRDVQAFYHTHAAFVLQLKERGLWNGVWLSQIPATALEQIATSNQQVTDASRLYVSLLARPLALHAGRGYEMACLLQPRLVMLPRLPEGQLDKLEGYPWSSAPYMASTHKGVMSLPMCFRPSTLHAKLTRATLSPPAGAEPPGKFLYRTMLAVAGFAMHKRLGDTNRILSSLGVMLPSTVFSTASAKSSPKLSGQQHVLLEQLVAHPAWAAAQAYLSADCKAAVRRLLEGDANLSLVDGTCAQARVFVGVDDHSGAPDGSSEEKKPLELEIQELRQRVGTLQQKLSEAKQLEQGWQTVALATEQQLANLRNTNTLHGQSATDSNAVHANTQPAPSSASTHNRYHTADRYEMPVEQASTSFSKSTSFTSAAHTNRPSTTTVRAGREEPVWNKMQRAGAQAQGHAEKGGENAGQVGEEVPAPSTKVFVESGKGAPADSTTTTHAAYIKQQQQRNQQQQHQTKDTTDTSLGLTSVLPSWPSEVCSHNTSSEGRIFCGTNLSVDADSLVGPPSVAPAAQTAAAVMHVAAAADHQDAPLNQTQHIQDAAATGTMRPATDSTKHTETPSLLDKLLNLNTSTVDASDRTSEALVSAASDKAQGTKTLSNTPQSAPPHAAHHSIRHNASNFAHRGFGESSLPEEATLGAAASQDVPAHAAETLQETLIVVDEMMQAAIERLAREDAEEQELLRVVNAEQRSYAAASHRADAVYDAQPPPCPAGFACSHSVAVPMLHPASAATSSALGIESMDVDGQDATSMDVDGQDATDVDGQDATTTKDNAPHELGERRKARAAADHMPFSAEPVEEDFSESLQQAQGAARQRAQALKAGRRMLTDHEKAGIVAIRDQEIVRTANAEKAHPMFQRAVSAAATKGLPSPARTTPNKLLVPPAVIQDTAAGNQDTAAGTRPLQAVTQDISIEEESLRQDVSPVVQGPLGPATAEGLGVGTGAQAAGAANEVIAHVPECGLGLGVGPAPHGNWKVAKIVLGGSVDRANSSATRRVQVGDILVSVDGASLAGISVVSLSNLVKGAHGSQVTVKFHSLQDAALHSLSVGRICE